MGAFMAILITRYCKVYPQNYSLKAIQAAGQRRRASSTAAASWLKWPIRMIFSPTFNSMTFFNPAISTLLADVILVAHTGIVAFVVLGQLLFVAGSVRGWNWVRHAAIRLVHLGLMVYVMVQSWTGTTCPLTIWEQALRRQGGQTSYTESFIEHWLARLIFFNAPEWVFVLVYTLFGALVLLSWWWIRPRWSQTAKPASVAARRY